MGHKTVHGRGRPLGDIKVLYTRAMGMASSELNPAIQDKSIRYIADPAEERRNSSRIMARLRRDMRAVSATAARPSGCRCRRKLSLIAAFTKKYLKGMGGR